MALLLPIEINNNKQYSYNILACTRKHARKAYYYIFYYYHQMSIKFCDKNTFFCFYRNLSIVLKR